MNMGEEGRNGWSLGRRTELLVTDVGGEVSLAPASRRSRTTLESLESADRWVNCSSDAGGYGVPNSKACDTRARAAVRLGLLRIGHFPGRNGGPDFNVLADVRGALGNVPLRDLILRGLTGLAAEFDRADVVAGVAQSGIAWAAMLADRTSASAAVINLDGPRASGLRREIEGEVVGRHVLLVDNLIARGESLRKAAAVVGTAGGEVVGAITVVADPGAALPFPVRSLWSLNQLIEAAVQAGQIEGLHEVQLNPNGATK